MPLCSSSLAYHRVFILFPEAPWAGHQNEVYRTKLQHPLQNDRLFFSVFQRITTQCTGLYCMLCTCFACISFHTCCIVHMQVRIHIFVYYKI